MKNNFRNEVEKENFLIHTILTRSRQKSRRKLKSLHSDKIDSAKQEHRYADFETRIEHIELPTFGDWKSQVKKYQGRKSHQASSERLSYLQMPINFTINQQQQIGSRQNVKQYENNKLKQLTNKTKLKQYKPLYSIDNIKTRKFCAEEKEVKRKLTQNILPPRERGIVKNFETIDSNVHKIHSQKDIFKSLYLKQKENYEKILQKYNIQEEVDDSQFEKFFNS